MNNNQYAMIGAAAVNFIVLLLGFARKGGGFKAEYLIDAVAGVAGAWPLLAATGLTLPDTAPWYIALVQGAMAGLTIKQATREAVKQMKKGGADV